MSAFGCVARYYGILTSTFVGDTLFVISIPFRYPPGKEKVKNGYGNGKERVKKR
ncbi:hypothetical protein [Parapedobacter koreensis]|uniref:hypothetical protein n=1 Tax=Parapedobacter koreensis TaxID=332977 RepID=UPI0015A61DA5|nr:hypothetical protein [Parapedobacter koreensis]